MKTALTRFLWQTSLGHGTISRAKRDIYVEREQVPFGASCFRIHTYILGDTTAYKYINPLYTIWRAQKIETGKKKWRIVRVKDQGPGKSGMRFGVIGTILASIRRFDFVI